MLLLVAVGCGGETKTVTETGPSASESPTQTKSAPETLEARLASCDTGATNELIGSVRLINNGTEATTAEVSFTWLLGNGDSVSADEPQSIEIEPAHRELAIFSKPANLKILGNFQAHPDYFASKNCEYEISSEND